MTTKGIVSPPLFRWVILVQISTSINKKPWWRVLRTWEWSHPCLLSIQLVVEFSRAPRTTAMLTRNLGCPTRWIYNCVSRRYCTRLSQASLHRQRLNENLHHEALICRRSGMCVLGDGPKCFWVNQGQENLTPSISCKVPTSSNGKKFKYRVPCHSNMLCPFCSGSSEELFFPVFTL